MGEPNVGFIAEAYWIPGPTFKEVAARNGR